ncbi:FxSxx-COOH system tetratricopeptide repeat protein [Nocardia sp. alder85J]|uniref:FxSxx-COOH system tetratricopeptide repeat protein n=1 Tax=Nocardia sp. alder85J TaxID=2862949 RepID=UPI001CD4F141|nr:FxSxx-COOH system tetratricopeptide repeat protein [Nocardia sp. alder85J]MCX4092498.1 FxSxx-COOH system tetratricopeptide repeat protein [Nocardia sp. alder85J]
MKWFGGRGRPTLVPEAGASTGTSGRRAVVVETGGGDVSSTVSIGGDTTVVQSARIIGDGNHVVQAGRDVVALPAVPLTPMAEVDAPPGMGNVPLPPTRFVGRGEHLAALDTAAGVGLMVVTAVHGLGGIGKSTLVAHWATTGSHGCTPVWWLTADSPAAVEQGLAGLAAVLEPVVARGLAVEQLAERAVQWLATHTGWLLVLDNVSDPRDIETVLARTRNAGGRVVVTSRLATGWQHATTTIGVDVLTPPEASALLSGIVTTSGPRDLDGAAELCAVLGFLPLAVEQAAAYLAQNPATGPRTYLGLLTGYPAVMFDRAAVTADPQRTVARIWRVTMEQIAALEPFAVELFTILAWWAPDNIPASLLDGLADPPTVDVAVAILAAYTMITVDPGTGAISVHRLVQAVTRTPDPHHRALTDQACDRATTALSDALPRTWEDPADWPWWRVLLPHIEALAACTRPDTDTDTTATVLNRTALFLDDQGSPTRAIPLLQRAFTERERVLGPDHPATLTSRNNLASAHESAGRIDEAITLHERTLTDHERVLGPDHRATLLSRNNLAGAHESAGRVDEAIPLYERNLTDRERVLGPDHRDTLASRNNLASAYKSAGRVDEAITLHERTLTDCERILGPDHPATLTSRNNLAGAHESAGRVDEAIPLHERNLTDRERVLGLDHPDTLASRNNLASAYRSAARINEAITLHERTLTDQERVLGPDHPATLTSRNNLAGAYRSAGRVDEAITLHERNLTDREQVLGTDHPDTFFSRNILANAYRSTGRVNEAITLYERNLTDRERVLGTDHPRTAAVRNNLAVVVANSMHEDDR